MAGAADAGGADDGAAYVDENLTRRVERIERDHWQLLGVHDARHDAAVSAFFWGLFLGIIFALYVVKAYGPLNERNAP